MGEPWSHCFKGTSFELGSFIIQLLRCYFKTLQRTGRWAPGLFKRPKKGTKRADSRARLSCYFATLVAHIFAWRKDPLQDS